MHERQGRRAAASPLRAERAARCCHIDHGCDTTVVWVKCAWRDGGKLPISSFAQRRLEHKIDTWVGAATKFRFFRNFSWFNFSSCESPATFIHPCIRQISVVGRCPARYEGPTAEGASSSTCPPGMHRSEIYQDMS